MKKSKKITLWIIGVLIACLACLVLCKYSWVKNETAAASPAPTPVQTPSPASTPESTINSGSESSAQTVPQVTAPPSQGTDGCDTISLDAAFTDTNSLLLLANKKVKLPDGYVPNDLVDAGIPCSNGSATMKAEAASALQNMYRDAAASGVSLMISSAYRGESYQQRLYSTYSAEYGQAVADTISSRPGYSDHQTGLAADFVEQGPYDLQEQFENTASGQWLAINAHTYGFIMRYPKGKNAVTGYSYEPWHFRYVGVDTATAIYTAGTNMTFEEYFGVPGGDYCN